jgi:hypothetical protein
MPPLFLTLRQSIYTGPRSDHQAAVAEFLEWLGVAKTPRPKDLLKSILRITAGLPVGEARSKIQRIFSHLGKFWKDESVRDHCEAELQQVRTLAWLPACGDTSVWHRPAELYATYSSYLFETQARFLDFDQQGRVREFIDFLGIKVDPTPTLVVNHLLTCANEEREVNQAVYTYLSQKFENNAVLRLRGKRCLLLETIGYVRPDHVFWGKHPFSRYGYQLPSDHRVYMRLFQRLGVRESPDADDAVKVLQEIAQEFGTSNRPLDEETLQVVMQCWTLLDRCLAQDEAQSNLLSQLKSSKVVPDDRRLLQCTDLMFFDDRPGLAVKFKDLVQHNIIVRPLGAWRAIEAAGVRPLSHAVQVALVECDAPTEAKDLLAMLQERRALIARVLEAHRTEDGSSWKIDLLDTLRVERAGRLEVTYTLKAFGQTRTTAPEEVQVYFSAEEGVLYFQGDTSTPWPAIARELAYALNPEAEAGKVASGLKDVLSAESFGQAARNLDELGYPPLEATAQVVPISQPVGLGGSEVPGLAGGPLVGVGAPETPAAPSITTPQEALGALGFGHLTPTPLPPGVEQPELPSTGTTGATQGLGPGGGEKPPRRQRSRLRTYVAPEGAKEVHELDEDAGERMSALEKAGVKRVLEYESSVERNPIEMPPKHPGYDIESRNASGEVERFIEVKSTAGDWDRRGVGVSREQFKCASERGMKYWLYVVERAEQDDFRIYRIQDPARKANQFFYDDGWGGLAEKDEAPPQHGESVV